MLELRSISADLFLFSDASGNRQRILSPSVLTTSIYPVLAEQDQVFALSVHACASHIAGQSSLDRLVSIPSILGVCQPVTQERGHKKKTLPGVNSPALVHTCCLIMSQRAWKWTAVLDLRRRRHCVST